jgi:hypothetical protein
MMRWCCLLALLFFLPSCGWKKLAARKDVSVDVGKPAPRCPEVGSAVDLGCGDSQVKLLAADYYHSIGDKSQVTSAPGKVFCVVELEWVKVSAEEGAAAPRRPELVDGNGKVWPVHESGLAAFLAMQPEGRFMDRGRKFDPAQHEAAVYEFPTSVAPTGLFLVAPEGCEATAEPVRFCLGKRKIK